MSERNTHPIVSREGAPLHTIQASEFERRQVDALKHTDMQPDTIYTAYVTSQLLRSNGYALSLDARIESIGKPITPFAIASFKLMTLNEDFQPLSTHLAEIDPSGNWVITNPDNAIMVRRSTARHIIDRVRHGYVIQHVDDAIDDLLKAPLALSIPTASPPLS